jgi:hypothetical protein
MKQGEPIEKKVRTAMSIFLKTSDYETMESLPTIMSKATMLNLMKGFDTTESSYHTAVEMLNYSYEKAEKTIDAMNKAHILLGLAIQKIKTDE